MNRQEILEKFCAKARCMHTQHAALRYWQDLKPHLTLEQRSKLNTAWGHHADVGEGPEELDNLKAKILAEWT
jgi:hypothetical protein